jgi:antitoxin component YwqK of YwqJK toxin-antitoxin module
MYHANGKLFYAVERIDADKTLLRSWTEQGVLILETFMNNKRQHHGPYRSWWNNGILKEEGIFQSDERVGTYRWFKLSGELWSEHNYENAL